MFGLLVNYEYCTGCHSCEVACKKYLELPKGEWGIKISEVGPFEISENPKGPSKWEWSWVPSVTKLCDRCESRTAKGKMPACVQSCQAWCMDYGEVEDLAKKIDGKTRYSLLVPAQ